MANDNEMVKVAVASDFFTAFSKIPRKQQPKVLEFVNKFRANPTLPSINYEKIDSFKDQKLRSVRIDQAYRGIVLKPQQGNVYVLLWVDHHDEAYAWARNKVYSIHPETGSLQVIDVEKTQVEQVTEESETPDLFHQIKDKQLISLGVPQILIPYIRSIKNEEDLDKAVGYLPEEVCDALIALAAGYSIDEVFWQLEVVQKEAKVDTEDYSAALDHTDSKARFYVAENEIELAEMLSSSLEKWRVFLHPSQRKIVERSWKGPVRILGGAGTGKTVVAMHRAKWLAQNILTQSDDRILFTTFTRNLAADINDNLQKICPKDVMRKIEVVNFDRWVNDFLKRNGYTYEIDYGRKTKALWDKALTMAPSGLGLDDSFYREEWERIIQQQSITSLSEYTKASRVGRGTRLSRKGRESIWPVFEEYRILLNEHNLREADDAIRDARILLENKQMTLPYKAVIVDESQDMSCQAFKLIRQIIPGDEISDNIFIVGDAHQRIYRHKIVLSRCGINVRGRSRKLRINYRTTEETRKWALSLLKGISIDDLDGEPDSQSDYRSLLHGVFPEIQNYNSFNEEVDFIASFIGTLQTEGNDIRQMCMVARTNDMLKQYEAALAARDVPTYLIRRSEAEDRSQPGLRLATMHRVKGLEFDNIIIAGVNEGVIPFSLTLESSDPVVIRDNDSKERALLYVAATRSKKMVLITSFGKPSLYLRGSVSF